MTGRLIGPEVIAVLTLGACGGALATMAGGDGLSGGGGQPTSNESDAGVEHEEQPATVEKPAPSGEPGAAVSQAIEDAPSQVADTTTRPPAAVMKRLKFALDMSMASVTTGSGNYWTLVPPDGTTLGIVHVPYCDDNFLRALHRDLDFNRLRQMGVDRVVCYPEFKFAANLAPGGDVQFTTPGEGEGWYCALINTEDRAGICFRGAGQCHEVAQNEAAAQRTCIEASQAYCSSDGSVESCFSTAEACVSVRKARWTPCVAKR